MTRARNGRAIFATSWLFVGLMTAAPRAAAQAPTSQPSRPVAALSDFSLRAVPVSKEVAGALKGLLHAKLAASGAFRLVPEKTLGDKLKELRKETLRACGDQGCLMELGQALAASHVIQPELIRVADRCMVALTIYDVRSATSELATTEECACQEACFLSAALKAANALAQAFARKGAPAGGSPRHVEGKISIFVSSKPSYAPIWIDGERMGRTPKLLSLTKGVAHQLKVGAWPYRPAERKVVPLRWQRVHLRLPLDRDDAETVAMTREWFAFGFAGGWNPADDEGLFGARLRVWQQRWTHLVWTALEVRFASGLGGDGDATKQPLDSLVTLASRIAYPLYWGRHGTHQLQLGMGAGYWRGTFEESVTGETTRETTRNAFALIPSLEYLYLLGNGGFSLGLGVSLAVPLREGIGTKKAPLLPMFSLTFGISGEATMRADAQGKIPASTKKRWKKTK